MCSVASKHALVPSSWGMFRYRLDTSVVTKSGGMGFVSRMEMSSFI